MTNNVHHESAFDVQVDQFLACAYELAARRLEGIEEAARELVVLSARNLSVIERARRVIAARVAANPDLASRQVESLIRRALEVGMPTWRFVDTGEVP